jgi:hypothetical protein
VVQRAGQWATGLIQDVVVWQRECHNKTQPNHLPLSKDTMETW